MHTTDDLDEFGEKIAPALVRKRTRTVLDPIQSVLLDLEEAGRVFVFGGVLRDLCHIQPAKFLSDVDLVVDGDPLLIDLLCVRRGGIRNRFGGFRFCIQGRMVDVWPLSRTWAISSGHVRGHGVNALLQTTYFSTDSIAYDIRDGRLHTQPKYFELRRSRTVDLVLSENPNPRGALARTVRMLFLSRVRLGWRLAYQTEILFHEHWNWACEYARQSPSDFPPVGTLARLRDSLQRHLATSSAGETFSLLEPPRREVQQSFPFEALGMNRVPNSRYRRR